MDTNTAWFLVSAALILIGLLGTVLPVLPGLPLMFAGMWLAAWADAYQRVGAGTLTVLGVLVLLSILVDLLASMIGARRVGASGKAMFGAGVGSVVGLFFGLPGLLAGPFLGASLGELWHGREFRAATRVGFGTWLGLLLGAVFKLLLALAMLAIFFAMLLLG
ncbi:DUF456 domain-containing protein [Arenimonas fontis]|uniref:DUF456 domain-containing protein n=1 Tax=Arenimonas fontis TaxID=2608255 RepID=A0A5B2ZBB0_9GAMM|nr:DUF456 family protein [Arenimonas fontis]KAA2284454.1 DUF456 domain-containing protein [Arenimonas fontis]